MRATSRTILPLARWTPTACFVPFCKIVDNLFVYLYMPVLLFPRIVNSLGELLVGASCWPTWTSPCALLLTSVYHHPRRDENGLGNSGPYGCPAKEQNQPSTKLERVTHFRAISFLIFLMCK